MLTLRIKGVHSNIIRRCKYKNMDEIMFMGENDHHPHMAYNIWTWSISNIGKTKNFTMSSSKFHCPCTMLHQYHHAHGDISLMSFIHVRFANFIYASGPL